MDAHRRMVHSLFSRIAGRYDLINTILSLNLDKYWRRKAIQLADPQPGDNWLDVCCGTGKLAVEIQRVLGKSGQVTGLDFNSAMLAIAKKSEARAKLSRPICWLEADAMELPFKDHTFDGVVIGFGLRNLPDLDQGIREMCRVIKPGGKWVCLELSHPVLPILRQGHGLFVRHIVPWIGNFRHDSKSDYQWLPESLQRFPGAEALLEKIKQADMAHVHFERLNGGIAAVHKGLRK